MKDTSRQRRKWDRGIGRARKLRDALVKQIEQNRQLNREIKVANRRIQVLNEMRPEDDQLKSVVLLDEFTHTDVCRVLGQ